MSVRFIRLQLMYQLVGDTDEMGEGCTCVRVKKYRVSAPSAQFCYEPQSALKIKSLLNKANKVCLQGSDFLIVPETYWRHFGGRMRRGQVGGAGRP